MPTRPIHDIEAKWQARWESEQTYAAKGPEAAGQAEKYYGLVEFPYPSGDGLHVGHPRSYTAIDLVTRKQRMQGKNVLYPMGWDAFGLPTENFAIKHKIPPEAATKRNVANFTRQTKSLGFGFDWSREVDTTDPAYYKWTQWQFLQFVKAGLAYKTISTINWCPACKIGLANEEAQGGVCERCGNPVEKREKSQWMIKITKYADRLIDDLETVDYLDKIKSQQINWIGRSEGAEVIFCAPKYEKVLIATNNKSKVLRVRTLLAALLPGTQAVTPAELGLPEQHAKEGLDMLENARMKAAMYAGLTDLPIIGMDTGLYITGEKLDIAAPKRNALGGVDEETLTQEEKAKRMDTFYRDIATRHGGEVAGYWQDVTVLRLPDGTELHETNTRPMSLTNQRKGEMDIYFPVRGLCRLSSNGKYTVELTPDEVIYEELKTLGQAFLKLLAEEIRVFTTRPDTIFGVTYVVVAPEHVLVENWLQHGRIKNAEAVRAYIASVKNKTDIERTSESKEKTGVILEGLTVTNPVNGEQVSVWIADYVLAGYGTGTVMAVPAHDERDFAFAQKNQLPMKPVVAPYIELGAPFAPKEGKEVLNRRVVTLIVHRNDTDQYLLLTTPDGRVMLSGGGVEAGETLEEAARREAREETGYEQIDAMKVVCPGLYGYGYQTRRDKNCFYLETAFLLEVNGAPTGTISAEEQALNDKISWHAKEEVVTLLNLDHQKYMWNGYLNGNICFTDEGMVYNSSVLDGLPTEAAKKKAVTLLEYRNAGKAMKMFRLRDWVFSRQRYWGEPIPLVHCGACENKKQKVLILHGFSWTPDSGWYPSVKQALERAGFEVMVPALPCTGNPSIEQWMDIVTPYMEQLGEEDMVVGHSIGARAALELLERTQRKIGRFVLVAPALGEYPNERFEARVKKEPQRVADFNFLRGFIQKPVQWEKITSLVSSAVVMWSSDDQIVVEPTHAIFPTGWHIHRLSDRGHFHMAEQPEVLEQVMAFKNTGWIPVPDAQLPITLPRVEAYEPTDTGESPLANIPEWVHTTCPKCGGPATRETDTMPNWAGSSWYFLRYCDPKNDTEFASQAAMKYWMPVDLYNGGMEHTTLHLLYSRFWHKFLYDMGYIPAECGSEPYRMRRSHNMILGEGGIKMSKSKGNVINPDDVVKVYGADVLRVYEMFIGPYDQMAMWDTKGIEGVRRFLDKVWNACTSEVKPVLSTELETLYHQTVKKIGEGIDSLLFNTCVSQLMILTNAFQVAGGVPTELHEGYLQLLAPFAPHLASELWEKQGFTKSLHHDGWPVFDDSKLTAATFELVVQINGKVRDRFNVGAEISEEDAKTRALASEIVQKWLEGKEPKKVVYVKGRLVTIVV